MSGYQNQQQRDATINKPKLVVRVIEARGIKAGDFGGTSDPFVEVRIKGQTHYLRTKTIKKTLSPCWNEELVLYPNDAEKDILLIKCYDYDQTTNNDLLGEIELPVALFVNRAPQEEWRQFQTRKGSTLKPGKGELKLSASYVSQQQSIQQAYYPQQVVSNTPPAYTSQVYVAQPQYGQQVYAAPCPVPQPTYYPPPQQPQPTYYPPPQPQPTYYPPPQQPQPVYYSPPQPQPTTYYTQQSYQSYPSPPTQQYAPPPQQYAPPPQQQYAPPPQYPQVQQYASPSPQQYPTPPQTFPPQYPPPY